MSKKAEVRNRIRKIMAELGFSNQAAFAKVLGFQPTTLSAWITAASLPSPDAYMTLGKMAPRIEDSLFFWEQAGLTQGAILSAAAKIMEGRAVPVSEGEIIRVPQFRETVGGREEAGPPIPLPAQFVPHALSTICLHIEENSPRVASSPQGLILLDTSVEGAEWREEFSGTVVMLDYSPKDPGVWPVGLYMGRLFRQEPLGRVGTIWIQVVLQTLTSEGTRGFDPWMSIGVYAEPVTRLGASPDDKEKWQAAVKKFEERAVGNLRLREGVRLLGKVIGRLTGHIQKEPNRAEA
jgi:hypothetical protein